MPALNIAAAAIAGLAMRLVQRLDVRHEPTSASPAAASVAAGGPYSSSRLKMKISPAANEFLERGTRTGVVNSRLLQGVHHVKQPLIFKIKHMVIRQRNGVYVRSCKGLHVFCIRAKMKHFGRG